ncbi:hypothetical protein [Corynebacterium sp. H130]|uniref:hypothetical protein n=1 Tax=Corynebacterium sp. H130 TaxID=3133444 RepID=UPI0030A9D677
MRTLEDLQHHYQARGEITFSPGKKAALYLLFCFLFGIAVLGRVLTLESPLTNPGSVLLALPIGIMLLFFAWYVSPKSKLHVSSEGLEMGDKYVAWSRVKAIDTAAASARGGANVAIILKEDPQQRIIFRTNLLNVRHFTLLQFLNWVHRQTPRSPDIKCRGFS